MEASGGSGSLLLEVLQWLWLPVLLGAAVALLTTPGWRRGAARHTHAAAVLAVLAVVAELVWRLLAPATLVPLAAWAAAFFVLSMALSALDRRRRGEPAASHLQDNPQEETPAEVGPGADPFRSSRRASSGSLPRQAWIELALTQTADAVAVLDLDGRIELVNPAWARLHGYKEDEVIGHHVSLFHSPEQMAQVRVRMDEVRAAGAQEGPAEHRKRNGTTFKARSSLSLLHGPQEEPVGFVAVATNAGTPAVTRETAVTKETAVAKETVEATSPDGLEQEIETLRVLAGSIAHEFNNLLTGILGNASLISQKQTSGEGDEVREIEAAARRSAELSKLLQACAGKARPTTATLRLGALIAESADATERAAGGNATLHYDAGGELPSISADPAQIRLVLQNLVRNAAEAAGGDVCQITVRTGGVMLGCEDLDRMLMGARRRPGTYVFLEVADTGPGLDAETRKRMFEPFFTTRPESRGLGLATVQSIARAHQGVIEVEGEPGAGTRVRVLFPASSQAEMPTPSAPGPLPEQPDESAAETVDAVSSPEIAAAVAEEDASRPVNGIILVVDNEKIILDLASSVLEINGYSVLTADEGEPAVALYREHGKEICAVLLDLSMPIKDGEEVFHEIRQMDPSAQVIMMTGHDAGDVRKGFENSGLADVLQKPFKPEQLVGTLRSVLGR